MSGHMDYSTVPALWREDAPDPIEQVIHVVEAMRDHLQAGHATQDELATMEAFTSRVAELLDLAPPAGVRGRRDEFLISYLRGEI